MMSLEVGGFKRVLISIKLLAAMRRMGLFIIIVSILFLACKGKKEQIIPDLGYNYFPIDSGWVKIYSVDSIAYNDNNQSVDTFHFLIREKILSKIIGLTGEEYVEVERAVQMDSSSIWQPRKSVFVLLTSNNLQIIDENIKTLKLVFPIGNVMSWNGNLYNNLGRRTFYLQNVSSPFNNGDTLFNQCITVQEGLANNAIEELLIKSVYQYGIGLVDFTNNYVNTQVTGKSGYKVRQKLISYTKP